ncbi:MAG: serine/threonine protein kinase [Gemmataceae bacterium]|nr:serine/threonine protein kinase [Gemmataceae bacterium]
MSSLQLSKGAEPYPGYRLVRFLGRGGWGEVWKAERKQDGAWFALKFLPSESQLVASNEIRALQAIRQLDHPYLVRTEQIWSCSGCLVIMMELAEGNLLDLYDVYMKEFRQPIFADHLCYYLSQVADALDFLNRRQHQVNEQRVAFRHCDVKPSNLLMVGMQLKLADFSLAVQTTTPICQHRKVGTLDYAAPEIFQGWLSERSDQYALAITYFQLRTGQLPFHDTPSSFSRTYMRPAPDLTGLSTTEQTILRRALAPVPQDRWPTCSEMMQRLTRAVGTPSESLQPVG